MWLATDVSTGRLRSEAEDEHEEQKRRPTLVRASIGVVNVIFWYFVFSLPKSH